MAKHNGRWIRLYTKLPHDAKALKLSDKLFRIWINTMCLSEANGGVLPPLEDLALGLRVSPREAKKLIEALVAAKLVDQIGDGSFALHEWDQHQFVGKSSTKRSRDYRERRVQLGLSAGADYAKYREEVYTRDGYRCVYCGGEDNLCIDHMVPTNQGGDDERDNLATACKACNSGKTGRTPEQAGYVIRCEATNNALRRYRETMSDGLTKAA